MTPILTSLETHIQPLHGVSQRTERNEIHFCLRIRQHSIGLFDMILLKDNHVDFAGGIHNAVSRAKEYCKAKGKNLKIELEVRNFDELNQALAEGVDRIMFDNFTPEDTRKAVEIVGGRCETESSGGITYDTMLPYAQAGVDFISFGALTHSVKGLDMSFKAC